MKARNGNTVPVTEHTKNTQGDPLPGQPGNKYGTWKKGQPSPNPGGRPKKDLSAFIAQNVFENSPEEIEAAFEKALKSGDARVFQVLADRGYGKLKEQVEHSGDVGVHVVDRLLAARKRTRAGDAAGQQDDRERE